MFFSVHWEDKMGFLLYFLLMWWIALIFEWWAKCAMQNCTSCYLQEGVKWVLGNWGSFRTGISQPEMGRPANGKAVALIHGRFGKIRVRSVLRFSNFSSCDVDPIEERSHINIRHLWGSGTVTHFYRFNMFMYKLQWLNSIKTDSSYGSIPSFLTWATLPVSARTYRLARRHDVDIERKKDLV